MKSVHAGAIARGLERLIDPGTVSGLSERQVLARFVERRDPVAFEAIVVRHGPMVLSVCRQMLRDANDVDDAFQATFVVLMEKAGSLKHPERLGAWLYGVAHRVALRARRRRRPEGLPPDLKERSSDPDPVDVEQLAALHEEIRRLPEKYRLPVVLCCVEEETHDEAATRLGWPIGTVHGRLARARDLLRDRLKRRGMVIPSLIDRQSPGSSRPRERVVPEPLLRSTVALSSAAIPTQLQTLVKGVLSAMFIEKLKSTGLVVALTALGLAAATTALLAFQDPAEKADPAAAGRSVQDLKPGDQVDKKAYGKASGRPNLDPIDPFAQPNKDGEDEAAAAEVGKMRAEVEILELKCEATRKRIERGIAWIDQLDDERGFNTPEQREEHKKQLPARREKLQKDLELWQDNYLQQRIEIARLNRRIARSPGSRAERSESSVSLDEVVRRIDRLEAKVDRIANSIAKGRGR